MFVLADFDGLLQNFYVISTAHGVKLGTLALVITPLSIMHVAFATIEVSLLATRVDHPLNANADWTVEDQTRSPIVLMKRVRDQDQSPLSKEYFSKRARLFRSGVSRSITTLLKFPAILPLWIPRTPKEATTIVSKEHLIHLWNLFVSYKMKLFSMLPSAPTGQPFYSLLLLLVKVISWPWVASMERDT